MWFASIWIFQLKTLPCSWVQNYSCITLDADPASNTLSWRWVAGLHTKGKVIVPEDKISKNTHLVELTLMV